PPTRSFTIWLIAIPDRLLATGSWKLAPARLACALLSATTKTLLVVLALCPPERRFPLHNSFAANAFRLRFHPNSRHKKLAAQTLIPTHSGPAQRVRGCQLATAHRQLPKDENLKPKD